VVVLEAAALAMVAWAAVGLARGHRVHETITMYGYLVAFLLVPPAGGALARLEPTRWGSLIIGVTGLVEAVLVVRLQQVWSGVG
jgi:ammonia channel protein AmtB